MKKFEKIITGIAIATMCIVLPAGLVKAAGTVSVSGDKDTAAVGDQYTVTVTVEGADGDAIAPDVAANYDVNRLEFVSCSGEYGGGGGGYITITSSSAEIVFNILSGGQADVDVTGIFDGDGTNAQVVTASVMVEGEDTAAVNELARDDAGTGVEPGSVPTADGRVVSAVFADEFMPVGFYKTTVTYEEQMVEAAQFDMGGIVLLYVTDADGNNGNFDIYDQTTGELSDFLQISGIENRFIIALSAGAEVEVPDNFTKATLQWNAQTLEAYAYTGTEQPANVNISDFFLLYAISSEGNTGWYMYDQSEGTYQRYVPALHGGAASGSGEGLLSQITSGSTDSTNDGGINIMLIIVIALAVLLLALIITVIVMAVKLHEFNSYDYIDEDEEEDEDSYLERLAKSSDSMRNQRDDDVRIAGGHDGVSDAREARRLASESGEEALSRRQVNDDEKRVSRRQVNDDEKRVSGRQANDEERQVSEPQINDDEDIEIEDISEDVDDRDVSEASDNSKSENIYEKYRREEEAKRTGVRETGTQVDEQSEDGRGDILEEFVVRRKHARIDRDELMDQEEYERDGGIYEEDDEDYNDEDLFSPRERRRNAGKLTRAEKKALKQEEKERRKAEKRMKKEYGEYGPVDWDSWQSGMEGGERTAAAHMSRTSSIDRGAVRREEMQERPARRMPREEMEERPVRRAPREEMEERPVRRAPREEMEERPVRRAPREEMEEQPRRMPQAQSGKDNPMDMMRGIPANDNKAPVQAKPVQQFDFDDDFEFEFLDLDDDD